MYTEQQLKQCKYVTEAVTMNYFQIFISVHSALQAHKITNPCAEIKHAQINYFLYPNQCRNKWN